MNELTLNLEKLRFEAAKAALQGMLGNSVWVMKKLEYLTQHLNDPNDSAEALKLDLAEDVVEFADTLIVKLKKKY